MKIATWFLLVLCATSAGSGSVRAEPAQTATQPSSGRQAKVSLSSREAFKQKFRSQVIAQIRSQWCPPCQLDNHRVSVRFKFNKDGTVSDIKLARSSGNESYDQAAFKAVEDSAKFDGCVAPFGFLFSVYGEATFDVVFNAPQIELQPVEAPLAVADDDISLDLAEDEVPGLEPGQGLIRGRVVARKSGK